MTSLKQFLINLFFGKEYKNFDDEEKKYISTKLNYFMDELKDETKLKICNLNEEQTIMFRKYYFIDGNYIDKIKVDLDKEINLSECVTPQKKFSLLCIIRRYFLKNNLNIENDSVYNKKYLLTDSIDKLNICIEDFLILHRFGINTIGELLDFVCSDLFKLNVKNAQSILFQENIVKMICYFGNQANNFDKIIIEILNLSKRTYNTLKRNGVNTIEELTSYTENELGKLNGIGKQMEDEIKLILKQHNLTLKNDNIDNNNFLEKPLYALDLPNYIVVKLQHANIFTIEDLISLSRYDLDNINNIGLKAIEIIECALAQYNLKLKETYKLEKRVFGLYLSNKTKKYLKNKKITSLDYLISLNKFDMLEKIITDEDVLKEIEDYIDSIFDNSKNKEYTRVKSYNL